MYPIREDEPRYAFLQDTESKPKNVHGRFIELVEKTSALYGDSLNINNDGGVGDNPNRYKQHGFHFTADNCIACHACEAACSEKNDNPAHLAFRSVGYVEGGTYPAYQRLNISMACNHCDNPVCLKGCPTRAYTKFAEYGAVLQDPDICFGCGYCTWVCPYNAPQLDPIKGQVTKCNMCVDRLEVGLKPACVAACLGKALDFGVIENTPENRDQAKLNIPGFPTTDITHPNIRFQQKRSLPREMTRADTMPVKYHRDDEAGKYIPTVDKNKGRQERQWNWRKLLTSHESSHVAFTVCSQSVMGAFALLIIGPFIGLSALRDILEQAFIPVMATLFVIMSYGMLRLNLHLGKPLRFYRGFNNLKLSPVSREIAGVSLFFAGFVGYGFFGLFDFVITQWLANTAAVVALLGGTVGFYYMYKLYRIPARPYWDHWHTGANFEATLWTVGPVLLALVGIVTMGVNQSQALISQLAIVIVVGILIEILGIFFHARDLRRQGGEGAASHFEQTTKFGNPYLIRNVLLAINLPVMIGIIYWGLPGTVGIIVGILLFSSIVVSTIIGRSLFYVLVIPTTMPGAFFWKNKGFEEHARETGLAKMPQVGVVADIH